MLRAYIRDMTRMPTLKPLAHTIIIGFQPATWPEAMTFNHRRGRRPPPRLPPSPLPQPEGVGAVTLLAQLERDGENPLQWKEEVHQKCKKNLILLVRLELFFLRFVIFFSGFTQ